MFTRAMKSAGDGDADRHPAQREVDEEEDGGGGDHRSQERGDLLEGAEVPPADVEALPDADGQLHADHHREGGEHALPHDGGGLEVVADPRGQRDGEAPAQGVPEGEVGEAVLDQGGPDRAAGHVVEGPALVLRLALDHRQPHSGSRDAGTPPDQHLPARAGCAGSRCSAGHPMVRHQVV